MKIIKFIFTINLFFFNILLVHAQDFNEWKNSFKKYALSQGVSSKTLNELIDNSEFLPNVIKYDRYQPEFYENTHTYIKKRTSKNKLNKGLKLSE